MNNPLPLLLAGLVLGFFASVPIAGPISILVFALGVENRLRSAFGVALGGAVAEALYAFLAFWGFSHYLARYPLVAASSRGVTTVILLLVGIRLIRGRQEAAPQSPANTRNGTRNGLLLGLTISLLNPTLILTWTVASGMVLGSHLFRVNPGGALPFSAGVCLGILGWFALLLHLVARYRGRFHPDSLGRLLVWMGWFVILVASGFGGLFLKDILGR